MENIIMLRRRIGFEAAKFARKVMPAYKAMNWKWYDEEITESAIELRIMRLALDLENIGESVGTGGITVGINKNGNAYIQFNYLEYV